MKRAAIATLLLATIAVAPSRTDAGGGLVQALPEDGKWTKYSFTMKAEAPQQQELSGTFTLRSVGKVTENGKAARWIEIEMKGTENGKEKYSLMKFLINEKGLKPGEKGSIEILRGWNKSDANAEIKELSDMEKDPRGMMSIFFDGTRKDVRKLKKTKVIDYQKGQLKIKNGTTSKLDISLGPNSPKGLKYDVSQSVWPHKSIPFGTAAMELKMTMQFGD